MQWLINSTITTISRSLLFLFNRGSNGLLLPFSMDLETISRLQNQFEPLFVVPLNNESPLLNLDPTYGKPSVEILDWWQSRIVKVDLPNKQDNLPVVSTVFEVTCVPSQHQSNRTLFDRNHSLWSGYTVTSVTKESQKGLLSSQSESRLSEELPELLKQQQTPFSCFFAGDTGYAYSPDDKVGELRCPAFKEIGKRFGGFDLALLPIGFVKFLSLANLAPDLHHLTVRMTREILHLAFMPRLRIVLRYSKMSGRDLLLPCTGG